MVSPVSLRHTQERFKLFELPHESLSATLARDVRSGLTTPPKSLPPKYFYDDAGSQLFEQICATPEYYPTRTERELLERFGTDIMTASNAACVIELGSGSATKTECLFRAAPAQQLQRFVSIDVSAVSQTQAAERLLTRYPGLSVDAWVADYDAALAQMARYSGPRLFVFLGGSIGNFDDADAVAFVSRIGAAMLPGDRFLLGADRVKSHAVLNAAYNDAAGVTAAFNLNVLRVINRELAADFKLEQFAHEAFFNPAQSRIEMHLRSRSAQTVRIAALDLQLAFAEGETILTEISRKFTHAGLLDLLERAGMTAERCLQPANEYFTLLLARTN